MAGTGNLILKRGTTIPQDGQNSGATQLLKAMPATQLVGLSHVVDSSGTLASTLVYAYENYPNRLWIGMDSFGTSGEEDGSGTGTGTGAGAGQWGGENGFGSQETSGAATRPIWFGAEIRADAAVYTSTGGTPDAVPTILQADWTNASDYVLVTQKSIKSYVDPLVAGKGNMTSFSVSADSGTTTTIINSDTLALVGGDGVDTSITNDTVTFALDLAELTTEGAPAVGDFLSGVDISASNVTRKFTIGTALGVLGGDISVNTSTGSATVSATNVRVTDDDASTTAYIAFTTASSGATAVKVDSDGLTYNASTDTLTLAGDLAVNGGDITTSAGTATVFNTTATSVSVGGAATTLNLGYVNGAGVTGLQTINIGTNSSTTGAKVINIGSNTNTGGATSLNVLGGTTSNITVNLGTNATTGISNINLGSSSAGGGSTVTVGSDLVVGGNFTVNGATTTINATTLTVDDKNIELGSLGVSSISGLSGTITNVSGGGGPWTADYTLSPANNNIEVGGSFVTGGQNGTSVMYGGSPTSVVVTAVTGAVVTYQVTGGTTPIAGTGQVFSTYYPTVAQSPTDVTASGGGITLKGTTDKTLLWNATEFGGSAGVWRSSESFSIGSGKSYAVVDDILLTKTYLKLYNAGAGGGNISIKSPNVGTDIGTQLYTLPSTLGAANQVLTVSAVSGGNDATLLWVDPSSLSTGAASSVTVRREIGGITTKYPIPFLASNAQNNPTLTQSGNDFSSWTETATKTGYLYSDYTSQTTGSSVTDMSSGLMYQVDESGTSTTGTLYCDYIGATLDCGQY